VAALAWGVRTGIVWGDERTADTPEQEHGETMAAMRRKLVGLREVAEVAGISIPAVSMALADSPQIAAATKERVRQICQDLGYPFKRPTRRKRTFRTALRFGFLSVDMSLKDAALAALLHRVSAHSRAQKLRLELAAMETNPSGAHLDQLREFAAPLDGLLVYDLQDAALLDAVETCQVPYVVIGYVGRATSPLPPHFHQVICDFASLSRCATTMLIERGHLRIGFLSERFLPGMYMANWLDGYRLALLDAHLPVAPELIQIDAPTLAGGRPAAEAFLRLAQPPTAYLCPDIRPAASFMAAMQELGHPVTPDVMVVGGSEEMARRYRLSGCPLVTEDADATAAAAIDLLLRLVAREPVHEATLVVPNPPIRIVSADT
jgi:LacI family transcriptional regulator